MQPFLCVRSKPGWYFIRVINQIGFWLPFVDDGCCWDFFYGNMNESELMMNGDVGDLLISWTYTVAKRYLIIAFIWLIMKKKSKRRTDSNYSYSTENLLKQDGPTRTQNGINSSWYDWSRNTVENFIMKVIKHILFGSWYI